MEDFADSYLAGETPIPCVRCNQRSKFRDLLGIARDLGAAALATGHYVRRVVGRDGPELHRAADASRDQSYFLFATTPAQLDYLRFPLGDLDKRETRALAERYGLDVAGKPDSQDICFVPQGRYVDIVARLRPGSIEPGEIVHLDGRVLGRHDGVVGYTVGQRRGLGLVDPSMPGDPLYVVRLEPENARVVVGPRAALGIDTIALREVNWLASALPPEAGLPISIKVRSAMAPTAARVMPDFTVRFERSHEGVAPGQAGVFYDGARVLGGGFIRRANVRQAESHSVTVGEKVAADLGRASRLSVG
jgi:tRNA-specific 2-thiouridylase